MAVNAQSGSEGDDQAPLSPAERRAAELYATDRQFQQAKPLDEVTEAIRAPGMGLPRIMATVLEGYADRPAFGERVKKLAKDPRTGRTMTELLPEFRTITYREVSQRIQALASELTNDAKSPVAAGDFVCTLGFTSGDYATVDLACIHLGLVSVPLHFSATLAELGPIVAESAPLILAASAELLETAVELALGSESLRRLVVLDCDMGVDEQRERFEAAAGRLAAAGSPVAIDTLTAMLERGHTLPPAPLCTTVDEQSLTSLLYTSGSTGAPKGAMYTQRLATYLWGASWRKTDTPVISLNFLPMSHLAGRYTLFSTLSAGGIHYFTAKSDLSTLFEDMSLARPTDLMLVPRVSEMLFQQYQSEVDRRVVTGREPALAEAELLTEMREEMLGGRIVRVMSGSAPLDSETAAFLESCLELKPHDGYGATEAGMITTGHKIAPVVIDHKLVDVPELGYFRTDSPYPRGELRIKTEMVMAGYYKRPEATAEAFDEEGFYKTGDIMAQTGPDEYVYVDRTKNVLKLSQGELVAISRLETVFAASPLIRQIFVHGSSERSYLLAAVVPTPEAIEAAQDSEAALKSSLSAELQRTAKEAGLNSYEIPRDFIVETEPFSTRNGLLSDAGKLARPRVKERYGERLEQMYADLASRQASELRALRREGRGRPVLETVGRAAKCLLGCSSTDLDPGVHFTDLGGDSLSAVSFCRLLGDIYEVDVPVSVVTSPATDLRQLSRHIEQRLDSGHDRPSFAAVHGADATEVGTGDLDLAALVDAEVLARAKELPRPGPGDAVRTVLLTGANGYLGRFMCLEWLERLAESGGTLICVVRGSSAEAARRRLDAAFDSGDAELLARYRESAAAGRLQVLAGDIAERNMGLDDETWNQLATDVDLIAHPAALVNHVLPYEQLFGPNVAGTAELVRLAITTRIKPFVFLSSVAVGTQLAGAPLSEDADIRSAVPVRRLDSAYAGGYGTSKWAGEVLLREAHDLCGLPCAVFRSDMILAHSEYQGQLNVPDLFTRLLLSLAATGIAPRSFYRTGSGGDRPRAGFHGLPADFTAEAVTTIGGRVVEGFHTYNVVNAQDHGVSLDVLVDWLAEGGRRIQHIDEYGEWAARIETALRGLPEHQRQHSLLPLMDAFREPQRPVPASGIPADRFGAAVREAGVGRDGEIPVLRPSLITKYVADLEHVGLL
ncbi:carboxylic acid reductase [Streptomyces bathyalis]|uniref:carboxylic acid reductase n=1 Tax=Streptomyces bathyalis TaxID=2710756 RepID=UPI0018D1D44A|nr:carboxylic acid reductase [Streptomyces bathyalis]